MNKSNAYMIFKKEVEKSQILKRLNHNIKSKKENLISTFIDVYGKEYEQILREKFEKIEFEEYFSKMDLEDSYLDEDDFNKTELKSLSEDEEFDNDKTILFGEEVEDFYKLDIEDNKKYDELIFNYLNYLKDYKEQLMFYVENEYEFKNKVGYLDEVDRLYDEIVSSMSINLKDLDKYDLLFKNNEELHGKTINSYNPCFVEKNYDLNKKELIHILWIKALSKIYVESLALNILVNLVEIINTSFVNVSDNLLRCKLGINSFDDRITNIKKLEKKYNSFDELNSDIENGFGNFYYDDEIEQSKKYNIYDIFRDDINYLISEEIFNKYREKFGAFIYEEDIIPSIGTDGELIKINELYPYIKDAYIKSRMYDDDNIFINLVKKENYDRLINILEEGFSKRTENNGSSLRQGYIEKEISESKNEKIQKLKQNPNFYQDGIHIEVFLKYEKDMDELINNIKNSDSK